MLLYKLNQYATITASVINDLFTKLDEIREKHHITQTFSTNIATQDTNITTTYPTKVKEDLEILSTNSYYTERPDNIQKQRISNSYANSITIPNVADLIKATEYYNDYVDIINAVDAICIDCTDYANYANYTADYPTHKGADYPSNNTIDYPANHYNFSNCEDYANYGNCSDDYANYANYCEACVFDFPSNKDNFAHYCEACVFDYPSNHANYSNYCQACTFDYSNNAAYYCQACTFDFPGGS